MNARRPPSPPPDIDGFTALELLGTGGFADVYLYEQHRPRRRVAVKVMLHDLAGSSARERFDHEANLMAQLSTHPSIVTIYEADIARDGRPYLAMEYCPRPSLGATYRRNPLQVAEVLRIGVQVAGAVETAHRAGILHRDIKPANILVTEYNRPALTDFGISATLDQAGVATEGMSIPWSPPESFTDPPTSSVATDVWALGATLWSLLTGRSPFEVPGGRNGGSDVIERIQHAPLPGTGRGDVPDLLERALATAMAKEPAARFSSALALARALQQVQAELHHATTPVDVLDDSAPLAADPDDDDPATRVRRILSIDPTPPPPPAEPAGPVAEPAGPVAEPAGPVGEPAGPVTPAPDVDDHTDIGRTRVGRGRPTPPGPPAPTYDAPASGATPALPDFDETPLEHTVLSGRTGPGARVAFEPVLPAFDAPGTTPSALLTPAHPATHTGTAGVQLDGADVGQGAAPRSRSRAALVSTIVAGVVVLGGAATALVLTLGGGGAEPTPTPTASSARPIDTLEGLVPAPTALAGERTGTQLTFRWSNPDPQDGDSFLWRPVDALAKGELVATEDAQAVTEAPEEGQMCIEVMVRRANGRTSEPTAGCVE